MMVIRFMSCCVRSPERCTAFVVDAQPEWTEWRIRIVGSRRLPYCPAHREQWEADERSN